MDGSTCVPAGPPLGGSRQGTGTAVARTYLGLQPLLGLANEGGEIKAGYGGGAVMGKRGNDFGARAGRDHLDDAEVEVPGDLSQCRADPRGHGEVLVQEGADDHGLVLFWR